MQRLNLLVAVSLAIASGAAIAQEKPGSAPSIPPTFVIISEINLQQGELVLAGIKTLFVSEQRLKKVEKNGSVEEVVETVRKPAFESRTEKVVLDTTDVYEAGGKKLDRESVLERAAVGTVAVASADGKKVDAVYLKALAKDTLVIVSSPAPPIIVPSKK